MKKHKTTIAFIAFCALALGGMFTGCGSWDGVYMSAGYYDTGFNDPWYYGGYHGGSLMGPMYGAGFSMGGYRW